MPALSAVVAGGGIGGLAAALSLAARGVSVRLFEREPAPSEAGAGIQLSPNASRILIALGLGEALASRMVEPEAVIVRRGSDGGEIVRMSLAGARQRWGSPYAVIHRADLQDILHAACLDHERIAISFGATVTGIRSERSSAEVMVEHDGQVELVRSDLAVAADGVWSRLRPPGYEPRFSGLRAWRAVLPASALPPFLRAKTTTLWLGPRAHVVLYPLRGGAAFNAVVVTADEEGEGSWSDPRPAEKLLEHVSGWSRDLRKALAAQEDWRTWPLLEGAPSTPMAAGRLAIIGDAAHAVLPFLAQGGALAIEDAATLAAWVADGQGDLELRLAQFALRRSGRVARIRRELRANGARYHWRQPLSAVRDLMLRMLGGEALLARNDWIYRWTPSMDGPGPS